MSFIVDNPELFRLDIVLPEEPEEQEEEVEKTNEEGQEQVKQITKGRVAYFERNKI